MIKIEHAMDIHKAIEDSIKRHSIIEGYRKYVLVEDVIEYLKNNTYGFRESGTNQIDADELIKILQEKG